MSGASPRLDTLPRDTEADSTDGSLSMRSGQRKRSFWQPFRRSRGSGSNSPTPAKASRKKRALSVQLSTESSPDFGATGSYPNYGVPTTSNAIPAIAVEDQDEHLPPMRRTRSFRDRTSRALSRVARRVSRRKPGGHSPTSMLAATSSGYEPGRRSPSPGRDKGPSPSSAASSEVAATSGSSAVAHASNGTGAGGAGDVAADGGEAGDADSHRGVIASYGEATSAELTDNGGKRSATARPEIEVTDASIADISAAVQQLTNRTTQDEPTPATPAGTTPVGSPVSRRRAQTTDSNKHLTSLLAPKKWRSRNRLLCGEWAPNEEELSWVSPDGDVVLLEERSVLLLSSAEQRALRKLLHKHLESDLGVSFHVPKEPSDQGIRGFNVLTLRPGKLSSGGDKGTSPLENCVFGIPLQRVLENDHTIVRRKVEEFGFQYQSLANSSNSLDDVSDHQSASDNEFCDEGDETTIDGQSTMNGTLASMDMTGSVHEADVLSDEAASFSALDFDDDHHDGHSMTRTVSLSEASRNPIMLDCHSVKDERRVHPPVSDKSSLPVTAGVLGLATAPLMFLGRSADNLLKPEPAETRGVEALTLSQIMKKQKRQQARQVTLAELELRVREHQRAVPEVLTKAFEFLKDHGMSTVGIFRVAGSKRRCRQLRDDLDSGFEITFISGVHQACDVAALVKNFLRDLPEPLLTRALFPAFVAAARIEDTRRQVGVLRQLICLLPTANRDTLYELLVFLYHVSQFSEEQTVDGEVVPGHKMDINNLAVVIGPNIMRPYKNKSGTEFKVSRQDQASNQNNIHAVVASLIRHYDELFKMSAVFQHELLLTFKSKAPALLDGLLQRRLAKGAGATGRRMAKISAGSHGNEFATMALAGGGGGRNTLPHVGANHSQHLLQHALTSTSHRPTPTKAQRRISKAQVDLDDFAPRSPENGMLIPSFAVPGSPLDKPRSFSLSGDMLLSVAPLDMLSITVHNLADRTPPEFKRRFPERSTSIDQSAAATKQRLLPPEDALFGNWQSRCPSSEDVKSEKSRASASERRPVDRTHLSSPLRQDHLARGAVSSSDDGLSREDDLSPMSGELTPIASVSHSELRPHIESTPMAYNHVPMFSPPAGNPGPRAAHGESSTLTGSSSDHDKTPTSSRPSSIRSKHKVLSRRSTEPSLPSPDQETKQEDHSWTRRGSRKIRQLKNYFESFHRGSDPEPLPMSPDTKMPPPGAPLPACAERMSPSPVSQSLPSGAASPEAPVFWDTFQSENVETMV